MTIGVWGDSIVYGSCDSEALGWAGRLRKVLPTDDYHNLYNFGICGETSEDVLRRFKIEANAIEPSDILFAVGINDSKYPSESDINLVPVTDYRKNLEELVSQAKKFTESITIIGATKVDEEWRSARGSRFFNEEIEQYNTVMQEVAEQHNLIFVDIFEVLEPDTDLADGLHPNAQGYQKMFEAIKDTVEFLS